MFYLFYIVKHWFHVKSEWQKNHEIFTQWDIHSSKNWPKFWLKFFWLTQQWWSSRWFEPQNWSGFSCVGNDMVQMFLCQFFRITRVMHLKSWKKWRIFIKNHLPRLEKMTFSLQIVCYLDKNTRSLLISFSCMSQFLRLDFRAV